jgi:hypothetical protein
MNRNTWDVVARLPNTVEVYNAVVGSVFSSHRLNDGFSSAIATAGIVSGSFSSMKTSSSSVFFLFDLTALMAVRDAAPIIPA